MIEPLVLYGQAANLFEGGSIKVISNILVVPVSKPSGYIQSLSLIRSSLARIEEITLGRPISLPRSPQSSIFSTSESMSDDLSPTDSERLPPAVPPKPIDMQHKPSIPPKPITILGISTSTSTVASVSTATSTASPPLSPTTRPVSSLSSGRSRTRGNSVSFAAPGWISGQKDHDTPPLPPPRRPQPINNSNSNSNPNPNHNPNSESTLLLSDMEIIRTALLDVHRNNRLNAPNLDILTDSVVDPTILVPARTDSGDSMALPSTESPLESVPRIPALPLLITHTILQLQIDHSTISDNHPNNTQDMITKVRNLYMSAATIPDLMQFNPHMVAYQLTLIDSAIFRAIPQTALLSHSPKSPHPCIVASTDFFNYFTRAIEHSILLPQEASRRAELVNRWIKIASYCLKLLNFQTLKAIVSALHSPPVSRLRRTWECIPKKRMQRLDFLHQLMSEANNYEAYRQRHMNLNQHQYQHQAHAQANCNNNCNISNRKPVVPFLGIFLHDITYLLAATKGATQDPRIQSLLAIFQDFLALPAYSQRPPPAYVKTSKKYSFRPGSFTNAFYNRSHSSSSTTTTTAASLASTASTALSFNKNQHNDTNNNNNNNINNSSNWGFVDDDLGKEQQVITQYILMRSWVTQPIIDELSQLREPPKNPRPMQHQQNSSYSSHHRSSSQSSASNGILGAGHSLFSLNSNHSNNNNNNGNIPVRLTPTTSTQSADDDCGRKSSGYGFWPFHRKSSDLRHNETSAEMWSEDDEFDDDELEDEQTDLVKVQSSISMSQSIKRMSGHSRSFSLPSVRTNILPK
ncbi:ras guanine nucleotide exchange factor domain-containing protein [Phycomyces blakesleeanus]